MKKKIKILVDAHVFDHSFQGTGAYIKGLYSELANNEMFEIVFCATEITKLKMILDHPKFSFIQLKTSSKIKRLLFELPSVIKKGDFDYAHFQYIIPPIKKCKYINTIHDILFLDYPAFFPLKYRIIKKALFQISAYRSNLLLTVSEYSKQRITSRFRINSEKIFVTPNAVNEITISNS